MNYPATGIGYVVIIFFALYIGGFLLKGLTTLLDLAFLEETDDFRKLQKYKKIIDKRLKQLDEESNARSSIGKRIL
jgi:hypothetical protein